MDKIVIAFPSEYAIGKVLSMLDVSGMRASARCHSGAEVIRAVKTLRGAMVVCAFKLTDMTADTLAHHLSAEALVLVLARPAELALCEEEGLFKLPLPLHSGDFAASLRMLSQICDQRFSLLYPKQEQENENLVRRAKAMLMHKGQMTEAQAHRFLQKKSMNTGMRLEDTAKLVIEMYE